MYKLARVQQSRYLGFTFRCKSQQTHYEILNVRQNSSPEEIRQSFLKLSKKYHPDATGDESTANFVKISEAYQILSKRSTRDAYDEDIIARRGGVNQPHSAEYNSGRVHQPWKIYPNYDPDATSYYGIKGMDKISNSKLMIILIFVGVVGALMGFISVKQSFSRRQNELDEMSRKASTHHTAVQTNAQKYGNEEQLKKMMDKMLTSSN